MIQLKQNILIVKLGSSDIKCYISIVCFVPMTIYSELHFNICSLNVFNKLLMYASLLTKKMSLSLVSNVWK